MTLPGILQPDAGRLVRAARRYAIAVLSRHCVLRLPAHKDGFAQDRMREAWDVLSGCSGALYMAYSASVEPETPPWRLLRVRVALYLRWCERVERMRSGDCDARWAYVDDSREDDWADTADALDAGSDGCGAAKRKENR